MAQLEGLFTSIGIYIGSDHNLRLQSTKVISAIKHTFEERLVQNWKEHAAMTRAKVGYCDDVVWEKDDGCAPHAVVMFVSTEQVAPEVTIIGIEENRQHSLLVVEPWQNL